MMSRPTLLVQTVYFAEGDREAARSLGVALYERLTRRRNDALAFGPGIPVRVAVKHDHVRADAAKHVIVVAMLGASTYQDQDARERALESLHRWHVSMGEGHVLIVSTSPGWRTLGARLPSKSLDVSLDSPDAERETLDKIVLATARALDEIRDGLEIQLFISHAKADIPHTDEAALKIHAHIVTHSTGRAFFDVTNLEPGRSLAAQLDKAAGRGVLVALRSDHYSSRTWCQRELLQAKQRGLPTLTVEILDSGEDRMLPYAGNGPSIVWRRDPAAVVSRAMVEWLKARHFQLEAPRILEATGLPAETACTARPPELLDLAQGPLLQRGATLVLHPDPELSVHERAVLQRAHPRLRLVTPTTAFRRVLQNDDAPAMEAPLDGRRIALSLSDSPDVDGPDGLTMEHVRDATVHLARTLIGAGAAIAYGGDFRRSGYSELLIDLIGAYNQMADAPADVLHSYVGVPVEVPTDAVVTTHRLADPERRGEPAVMSQPDGPIPAHRKALYFSDMRRVMSRECFGRVVLGGNSQPRTDRRPCGYGGRFPGVVEEAWRTLEVSRPLYVAGGFGGAAGLVADLLEGKEHVPQLSDASFMGDDNYRELAAAIDADPDMQALGLPESMDALAAMIRACGGALLASDTTSQAWNGLTVAQNKELLRSQDPVRVASLVAAGLLRMVDRTASGSVRIELVRGDITEASDVDAIAVAVFSDVEPMGAGAALDRELAGRLSSARAAGQALVSIPGDAVDADWLYLADLGRLGEREPLDAMLHAASETARTAARCGFSRVAVVTFGGNVAPRLAGGVDAMVRGFSLAASSTVFVWFEIDEERFDSIRREVQARDDVLLSARRMEPVPAEPPPDEPQTIASVRWSNSRVTTTILPPRGTAAVYSMTSPLDLDQIVKLARGNGGATPTLAVLDHRGEALATALFGERGSQVLEQCRDARLVLLHDVESAGIPFEILRIGGRRLAIDNAMVRRPLLEGLAVDRLFARPMPVRPLRVQLIVNPTEDLHGAEPEATALRTLISGMGSVELLEDLTGAAATKKRVAEMLRQPDVDVLHYIGHAYFRGSGPDDSGLICAGGEPLTLRDMAGGVMQARLVFMNACEAGRVRGGDVTPTVPSLAFAELFLRAGVEAYLGTFWKVGDAAASHFAASVYEGLAAGQRLVETVSEGRRKLLAAESPDWANYILYGDGALRMRRLSARAKAGA